MYGVDLYRRVRLACHQEGLSRREAARRFGIDRKTVAKMLSMSVPPGCRRNAPARRPKLDPFTGIIEGILEVDREGHRKQRQTAKRIFERLRDEHGFTGGYTIVKDYVRERRRRSREMFVPLTHAPGHTQVDFGEALAVIGGVMQKVRFFAFERPQRRLHHSSRPDPRAHGGTRRQAVSAVPEEARSLQAPCRCPRPARSFCSRSLASAASAAPPW